MPGAVWPALLDLFHDEGVPATFFIPGAVAEDNADVVPYVHDLDGVARPSG